jgi:hypothetical protein
MSNNQFRKQPLSSTERWSLVSLQRYGTMAQSGSAAYVSLFPKIAAADIFNRPYASETRRSLSAYEGREMAQLARSASGLSCKFPRKGRNLAVGIKH